MSNQYQALPTGSPPRSRPSSPSNRNQNASIPRPDDVDADEDSHRPLRASVQAEFNRPPPATWKRALLILAMLVMAWASVKLGGWGKKKPEVIYASRYNEEFKYRPAASPVITEYLKDGRMRLRGATVGGVGVREQDIPKTPAQKKAEEKKRIEEARAAAKERLGLKRKGKKGKKSKKSEI